MQARLGAYPCIGDLLGHETIVLVWEGMIVANTLAYYETAKIMVIQSSIVLALGQIV